MPFQNEIILIASIFVFFGGLVAFFRFFGKQGIFAWTVICTIAANIEVLILVHAFGLDTTLGNVIFASSFLATDIMSEIFGKKEASRCVKIGILANVTFILISQSWFLYIPAAGDTMAEPIRTVFANTPRVMLASLFAYAICEMYDVWAYHAVWKWSERVPCTPHRRKAPGTVERLIIKNPDTKKLGIKNAPSEARFFMHHVLRLYGRGIIL